jgi:DNA-binding transcriptional ArsR family regulator
MRLPARSLMRRLTDQQVDAISARSRALGEPTRVRILEVLAQGEQPVGVIAAAVDSLQSTVSKHLQVLFHAGLVERRRSASAVIYSIADPELLEWCRYLGSHRLAGHAGMRR